MSTYLYRLAQFAFRRRRLVLGIWLAAAIAAIAIAQLSGGKTNDNFTIPGTEAQNASDVLSAKLPACLPSLIPSRFCSPAATCGSNRWNGAICPGSSPRRRIRRPSSIS